MADSMTIIELAEQVGMTPRNIRAYQSRGLLFPPHIEGRVAF
jgi:DNA-binding transcriptional MerR regulator